MSNNLVFNKFYEVLIVEDEPVLALSLKFKLLDMGLGISGIATTPNRALAYVKNNPPDLAIVDINLNAKQTGIDVANYIWKNYSIPIIFLTSYCDDNLLSEAMDSEPYAYLIKPCKDNDLKAAINTALHKHQYFFKNKESFDANPKEYLFLDKHIKLDRTMMELFVDDTLVSLTKNEKKLFELLSQNPGKIISFNMIFNFIWREDVYDLSRLRSLIYRIKNKLGSNVFESVYEQGYKIKTSDE